MKKEKKSTFEERMAFTEGMTSEDMLTPEQREAYINMNEEEAAKFEREVIDPLLRQHLG